VFQVQDLQKGMNRRCVVKKGGKRDYPGEWLRVSQPLYIETEQLVKQSNGMKNMEGSEREVR